MPEAKVHRVLYKLINWYTQHFPFPYRGWKYFRRLLIKSGLETKTFIKKTSHDLKFYVQPIDEIQKDIFWYGYYDKEDTLTFLSFIEPRSVVLDIGANIGYFTLFAARQAREGYVYAFEPVYATWKKITANIELNKLKNISIIRACANNSINPVTVFIASDQNIGMSSLVQPENFSGKTETVQSVMIDEWADEYKIDKIDLVKIDTEGSELKVLFGMKKCIEKYNPVFFIEIINEHLNKFGNSATDIYEFFFSLGYNALQIVDTNTLRKLDTIEEDYNIIFVPPNRQLPSSVHVLNS